MSSISCAAAWALAELAALGIDNVISTAESGWQKRVKEMTGGAPIVAALDSVGGEESGQLLHMLAEEGGQLHDLRRYGQPTDDHIDPGDLIFKQATIKGFWAAKLGSGPRRSRNSPARSATSCISRPPARWKLTRSKSATSLSRKQQRLRALACNPGERGRSHFAHKGAHPEGSGTSIPVVRYAEIAAIRRRVCGMGRTEPKRSHIVSDQGSRPTSALDHFPDNASTPR